MYADDIMSLKIRQTLAILKCAIETTYTKLQSYCNSNRLKLNSDKTHFMLVKSNQRRRGGEDQTVKLDSDLITESTQERVLGIIISRAVLDCNPHLDKLLKECAKKSSIQTN